MIDSDRFIWSPNDSYRSIQNAIASQARRHSVGHHSVLSHRCLCLSLSGKRVFQVSRSGERAALSLNFSRWPRSGLGAFFIYRLEKKEREAEKKERETKERIQHLRLHGNALLAQFRKFDEERYMLEDGAWKEYILSSPNGRELLDHFYTGHREMYNLLDVDESKFQEQLNCLLEGNGVFTVFLQGACNQCLNYHDEKDIPQLRHALSQPH